MDVREWWEGTREYVLHDDHSYDVYRCHVGDVATKRYMLRYLSEVWCHEGVVMRMGDDGPVRVGDTLIIVESEDVNVYDSERWSESVNSR